MPKYKPYSYEQGQFLSVQFEKQILPDSFEGALNYIVDNKLDVSAFENRIKNDETGAPAYNPRILLKIIFYGYARGITSSRDIEKACYENVMFMALSANTRPHFTTIANFISTMSDGIEPLFLNILMMCDKMGLIGKEMFAIDGCKIRSNASKEWSGTREDFKRKKKKYRRAISYLINKHQNEDEKNRVSEFRKKEEKAKEVLKKKIEKIEKWLEENDDKEGQQGKVIKSHLVDNESAKMVSSHGVVQGYNGVAAVDSKTQVIVQAEAYGTGSEQETLEPMIDGIKETFQELGEDNIYKDATVVADSGFHSEKNMKKLLDEKIAGYIADHQMRKRDPRFKEAERYKKSITTKKKETNAKTHQYYEPDDFKLDKESGKLICPAGKELYVRTRNFKTWKGMKAVMYTARERDCRVCGLRSKCLRVPTTKARSVYKFTGWDEKIRSQTMSKWMKDRIDSVRGRFLYSRRMGIVEPVFANIREMLGLNRFTLRGKKKVNAQWKMYAMVHNMFKIYRYGWNTG